MLPNTHHDGIIKEKLRGARSWPKVHGANEEVYLSCWRCKLPVVTGQYITQGRCMSHCTVWGLILKRGAETMENSSNYCFCLLLDVTQTFIHMQKGDVWHLQYITMWQTHLNHNMSFSSKTNHLWSNHFVLSLWICIKTGMNSVCLLTVCSPPLLCLHLPVHQQEFGFLWPLLFSQWSEFKYSYDCFVALY